jgi:hypothetical protein
VAHNPGLVGLFISWTLRPKEQRVRLFAMESGIRASLIRAEHPAATESQAYLDAWTRLDREVRPRLLFTEEVGPEPTYPHMLAGKPFDPWTVLAYRAQLMQATGATACLIVVDDFNSIGVPRDSVKPSPERFVHDFEYDSARFNQLDLMRRMTISAERPLGDPVILITGIRKQSHPIWPYCVKAMGLTVAAAECVAFLVPRLWRRPPNSNLLHVVLRVAKAQHEMVEAAIPMDFDTVRYRFTEVPEEPGDVPAIWRRDPTWD